MLSRFLVFIMMSVFLIPITITFAQESQSNDTVPTISNSNSCADDLVICFVNNYSTIIVALLALIGSLFGTSLITQWYRLRNLYTLPYIQWCVSAYGTIHEFKQMCDYLKNAPKITSPILSFISSSANGYGNPIFIISHLWEIHREAEKGYKLLGQIKNEDCCAHKAFDKLFDDVDHLWHYLEETYPRLISSQTTADNFRKTLSVLLPDTTNMAIDIITRIQTTNFAYMEHKNKKCPINYTFTEINDFLNWKIPKPAYKIPLANLIKLRKILKRFFHNYSCVKC